MDSGEDSDSFRTKAGAGYALREGLAARNAGYWRVAFSRQGVRHQKTFYFLKYGGRQAALAAATSWRDQHLESTPALTVLQFAQLARANNTSGAPGVSFERPARQAQGIWQARLTLGDGTRWRKSFSVRQYGYEEAFNRAVEARERMLASATDRAYVHDPFAAKLANAAAGAADHAAASSGAQRKKGRTPRVGR
jgi:AP2 domain